MELEIGVSDKAELFIATYFGSETEEEISADIDTITERVLQCYGSLSEPRYASGSLRKRSVMP